MCIVLSERAHACQSVQLTTLLVAVNRTELRDAQRQVLVTAWLVCENLTMVRTVHRLQHILLVLLRSVDRLERVLAVVSIVARSNIQVLRADMRSDNLLIAVVLLYLAQHVLQTQTQVGTLRQPYRQTLAHTVAEHEEFHLLANLAVVALLSLLQHHEILVQHLLLRERDTVDTSHLLAVSVAAPESTRHARYLDGLDSTCRCEVRTAAEVGKRALRVCRDGTVLKVLVDVLALILLTVGLELLQGVSLRYIAAHHRLVLACQFLHLSLNLREVVLRDSNALRRHHVVEESVLDGRTETELNARIKLLQRLGKQVSTSVPESVLALLVLKLIQGDGGVFVDRSVKFYCLAVHSATYNAACQSRRNAFSNLKSSHALLELAN